MHREDSDCFHAVYEIDLHPKIWRRSIINHWAGQNQISKLRVARAIREQANISRTKLKINVCGD